MDAADKYLMLLNETKAALGHEGSVEGVPDAARRAVKAREGAEDLHTEELGRTTERGLLLERLLVELETLGNGEDVPRAVRTCRDLIRSHFGR